MSRIDEAPLIQRAQKGDKSASDKIVMRYFQHAKRACRLHASLKGIGDKSEADSAAYEVLLAAMKDFRADAGASFVTFLGVKAKAVMMELARKAALDAKLARELTLEGEDFETASGVPDRSGCRSNRSRTDSGTAERIAALRGPEFLDRWLGRRKGVDPINQDIARMLWRDNAPVELGEPIRHYTIAEVADELHLSTDTILARRAKIIVELTGKSEEQLLAAPARPAAPAPATPAPQKQMPVPGLTKDEAIAALVAHFDEVLRHGFDFDGSDSDRIGGSLLDDLRMILRAGARHHRNMQTDIKAAAVRLADFAENEIRNYAGAHYDRLRRAIAVIRKWHP
jgi:hypothetical protein